MNELLEIVTYYRKELHQIPEIGFDLEETSLFIRRELDKMNVSYEVVAKCGIVVYFKGLSSDAIAFRADMDALSVLEKTNLSYASKYPGKMHACGHDGHMAMLLGFARYLSTIKNLKKSIVLIFQPAEEGPGGAEVIIKEGLFDRYDIKAIFGIHLYPELEEGLLGLVDGAMMAQNGEFDIIIKGTSTHAAIPHKGNDTIIAASQLITNYQAIISRMVNPLKPAVITFGLINGGEARNIIAKEVSLSGTVRCFDSQEYQNIKNRMMQINKGIEEMYDVKIEYKIEDFYPPVINNSTLYKEITSILKDTDYKVIEPMMVSEDFSLYQQQVPGLFVMLGTRNESLGFMHPLHSGYFNFNEGVLIKGIKYYQEICKLYQVF